MSTAHDTGELQGSSSMFRGAFVAPWTPVTRTAGYRVSLVISGIVMLLVPLIYIAAVGALGWLLYWHFTTNTTLFGSMGTGGSGRSQGKARVLEFFLYIAPGVIGAGLMIFLMYPLLGLLFGGGRDDDAVEIFPSEEPRLFGFVQAVCSAMGAPMPERIFIDCTPNAAAQLLGGPIAGVVRGRLGLHIGLPLVAGMDANTFAAVLAHEFGHFSQGAGMRTTMLIGSMGHWMSRAAFTPGPTDKLAAGLIHAGSLLTVAGYVLLLLLWVARLIMRGILFVSYLVFQFMSRRMEYDADAHAARFVGSKAACAVWPRLLSLGHASHEADRLVADQWRNRKLPEDMPAFMASISRRLSTDAKSEVNKRLTDTHTSFFDSHPAVGTRIEFMTKLDEPGIFRLDAPASSLFTNFADTSKRASYNFFKERVEEFIQGATFVPADAIFGSGKAEEKRAEVATRYIGFEPPDSRPLNLNMPELSPAADPKAAWEKLKAARAAIEKLGPAAAKAAEEFVKADQSIYEAQVGEALFGIGFSSIPKEIGFAATSRYALNKAKDSAREQMVLSSAALDDGLDAARLRVATALRLLAVKGSEKRIPNAAALRERAALLVKCHAALMQVHGKMQTLRVDFKKLALLYPCSEMPKHRDKAREAIRPLADAVRDTIIYARQDLGAIPAPFAGPDGTTNLGDLTLRETPPWREYDQILSAAADVQARYTDCTRRVINELIEIAAVVEHALRAAAAKPPAADSPTTAAAKA